jgi:hypothetical protein
LSEILLAGTCCQLSANVCLLMVRVTQSTTDGVLAIWFVVLNLDVQYLAVA